VCTRTGHPSLRQRPRSSGSRVSSRQTGRIITPAWVSSQSSSFADTVNEGLGPARADVRARVVSIRRGRTLRRFGPSRSRARWSSPIIHEWARPSCCKARSGGIRCVGTFRAWLLNRAAHGVGQPQRRALLAKHKWTQPTVPEKRCGKRKRRQRTRSPCFTRMPDPSLKSGNWHTRPLRAFNQCAHAGREVGDRSCRSE
jgi:hypothetical protein